MGLVALTCVLYLGDLELGFFHLDDPGYVTSNPWIREVSTENIAHILTEPHFANYSPLHILSYLVDHAVGGLDPRTFHLSSNLWAGAAAALVGLLGYFLTRRLLVAAVAGVLFAVHPVHVEAVVWISSRKDLVATVFAIPCVIAWLMHSRGKDKRRRAWYVGSLFFFVCAVAGKLSVVVLPGILVAIDYFLEEKRDWSILVDKIPFGLVALPFVSKTMGAQPATGYGFDPSTIGEIFLQNVFLLTGFADYVIYRARPVSGTALGYLLMLVPLAALVVPWLLRKRLPAIAVVSVYWVLFSLVPSQVLSFVHPVTDRYLFFPSVGVALLLAWGAWRAVERWKAVGAAASAVAVGAVALIWALATATYIGEWRDPRTVWFAAAEKSDDVNVFFYLGSRYQDTAREIEGRLNGTEEARNGMVALARLEWEGADNLEALLREWENGQLGSVTEEFRSHLRAVAWDRFEQAVQSKGGRILPNLFFRRGLLQTELNRLSEAREEFLEAHDEAQRHTFAANRQEVTVMSLHALGVVAWQQRSYDEALDFMTRARDAQTAAGRTWVAGIQEQIEQLRRLAGRS